MLELSPTRKNKINLSDYSVSQDIDNRMMLSDFTSFEHALLEEILFSPLKFPLKKLARSLECSEEKLTPVLNKLKQSGLITQQEDQILVDKEMRKYFEFQLARFDEDFKPDMEFLQGLLKKVPIHVLPIWYTISRTSNNIFDSIVEKFLSTPQVYSRYLAELNLGDSRLSGIIEDLFSSEDYKVSSSDLIGRYNLERREFEEIMILLEFNFVCCLSYEKADDHWIEWVTPFYEWRQYLLFLRNTETPSIKEVQKIVRKRDSDFAFIEDISTLLKSAQLKPLSLDHPSPPSLDRPYFNRVVEKATLLKLAEIKNGSLYPTDLANDWLEMTQQNRALYLYRHPLNQTLYPPVLPTLAIEKNLREAERAVKRILEKGWVLFDDFLKGVIVHIDDDSHICLKRTGKTWRYALPQYSEEKKALIRATVLEWLFEIGLTAVGTFEGKECLCVTPFGRLVFAN